MICEIYVYNKWNDISPSFHQKTIDFYLLKWYNIGVKRKCEKHSTEVKRYEKSRSNGNVKREKDKIF